MGTLTYLMVSILCAVLQHEILASPSDGESSTGSSLTVHTRKRTGPSPEYAQGIRTMYMDNPTKVKIIYTDDLGTHTSGFGWAVHPYFVVVRPKDLRPRCKIASFQSGNMKHFDIERVRTSEKGNISLVCTRELILLDNGRRVLNGLQKDNYDEEEYKWVAFYVGQWIKGHTLPIRYYRGNED